MPQEMKGKPCGSCGQPVYWVTMISGKKMPMNTDGKTLVMHVGKNRWKVVTGFESHWATCPQSELWREKAKKYEGEE